MMQTNNGDKEKKGTNENKNKLAYDYDLQAVPSDRSLGSRIRIFLRLISVSIKHIYTPRTEMVVIITGSLPAVGLPAVK